MCPRSPIHRAGEPWCEPRRPLWSPNSQTGCHPGLESLTPREALKSSQKHVFTECTHVTDTCWVLTSSLTLGCALEIEEWTWLRHHWHGVWSLQPVNSYTMLACIWDMHVGQTIGLAQSFTCFFCKMLWKNLNELFGQLKTKVKTEAAPGRWIKMNAEMAITGQKRTGWNQLSQSKIHCTNNSVDS